jgi:hypothetical protein
LCLQVGNAVPPPLAKSIGLEIRKSLELSALRRKAEAGTPKKNSPQKGDKDEKKEVKKV